MPIALNEDIAGRLDEVSRILAEQEANRFRVQAYQQAATALRGLSCPVSEVFAKEGIAGLEKIPGVGETIARSIRDILLHGKLAMLQRLRGETRSPCTASICARGRQGNRVEALRGSGHRKPGGT
jgi:DNA polymerase/3'-5' exonuclease PolX